MKSATTIDGELCAFTSMILYSDRLQAAMTYATFIIPQLAKEMGVSYQAVARCLQGYSKAFNADNNSKAANVLGVNPDWLATGIGGMLKETARNNNVAPGPDISRERRYPEISWVQAGEWTDLCDNFQPGDADTFRQCHRDLGPSGYVLRVAGDSMSAGPGAPFTFPPGILLYVNPDAEAIPGKFIVVRRQGEGQATFKKLVQVDGDPYLEAINPTWPNRYIKMLPGDVICGVVMHAGFDMP